MRAFSVVQGSTGHNYPISSQMVADPSAAGRRPRLVYTSDETDSAIPHQPLTDEAREQAIVRAGKAVEKHMATWERDHCFAARGDADRALRLMEQLIAGRSAEMVARLARERGLL